MANRTAAHHYIPRGYLKRWATQSDGNLCRFKWTPGGLSALRLAPAATGYEPHLYTSQLDPSVGDRLEREIMAPIDNVASKVLDVFNSEPLSLSGLSSTERDGFARFVMSLMHRSPARLGEVKAQWSKTWHGLALNITEVERASYAAEKRPHDPERLEDYIADYRAKSGPSEIEVGALNMVAMLSDSQTIGTLINGMWQTIIKLETAEHELLTSDRPLLGEGPLRDDGAYLMLAVGPRRLWLAAHSKARLENLIDADAMVASYNVGVCKNAEKFVYGTTGALREFVAQHFAKPAMAQREPREKLT